MNNIPYFEFCCVLLCLDETKACKKFSLLLRDTAAGFCRELGKRKGGQSGPKLQTSGRKMNSLLVCFLEKDEYQQRQTFLAKQSCPLLTMLLVTATSSLCFTEALGHLYFIANCFCWHEYLRLERRNRGSRKFIAGWRDAELCIIRMADQSRYDCAITSWWGQYMAPVLSFVPSSLDFAHYRGLAIQHQPNDKTRVSTIALTECIFMAVTMIIISIRDGACLRYCTHNARFNNVNDYLWHWLSVRILEALEYFRLCRFSLQTSTEPI